MEFFVKNFLIHSTSLLLVSAGAQAQLHPSYGNAAALRALFTAPPLAQAGPIDTTVPVGEQPPAPQNTGGGFFGWFTDSSTSSTEAATQEMPQDPPQSANPSTGQPQETGIGAPETANADGRLGDGGSNEVASRGNANDTVGGAGTSLRDLTGRVGIAYTSLPNYFGADEGRNRTELLIDATFGANGFLNNDDGLGFYILSLGALESKISLNTAYGQVFSGKTEGLSALKRYTQLEADLLLQTFELAYELELAIPLSGPDGWTLTGSVAQAGPLGTYGTWNARLGTTYASGDWMESYYGISTDEAAASGLNFYEAGSGLRDVFLEAQADVPVGTIWGLDMGVGTRYLLGDARNAPQVTEAGSKTDYYGHMGIYYRF